MKTKITFQDILAALVIASIIAHSYIKNVDMGETYKAVLMAITMWYWGSSKSSQSKDAVIKDMQESANKPTVTADVVNTNTVETVNSENTNIGVEEKKPDNTIFPTE